MHPVEELDLINKRKFKGADPCYMPTSIKNVIVDYSGGNLYFPFLVKKQ
jgi:hypothetical protein